MVSDPRRNIVLCIDGSWNKPRPGENTNVRKLFEDASFALDGPRPQITYYLPGVGEDIRASHPGERVGLYGAQLRKKAGIAPELPALLDNARWRQFLGGGFGKGTAARIKEAYAFLCAHYVRDRGDRVYLFGFSRGAYAARSLAGFLDKVGTILATDPAHLRFVEEAYRAYETDTEPDNPMLVARLREFVAQEPVNGADDRRALPIHFLGVWDTVGALGLPRRRKKFEARRTEYHALELPPTVLMARHALALHELRSDFAPLLWRDGPFARNVRQRWFPGAHADVGGGYALAESGLADEALRWMASEARAQGLQFAHYGNWWQPGLPMLLHHEVRDWFFWATPHVREALQDLHAAPECAPARYANAQCFDPGVGAYLLDRLAPGAPAHQGWKSSIGECLTAIDALALQTCLTARLRAAAPHGMVQEPAEPVTFERLHTLSLDEARALRSVLHDGSPAPPPLFQAYPFHKQIRLAAFVCLALGGEAEMGAVLEALHAELKHLERARAQGLAHLQHMEWAVRVGQLSAVTSEIASLLRWKFAPPTNERLMRLAVEAYHDALHLKLP